MSEKRLLITSASVTCPVKSVTALGMRDADWTYSHELFMAFLSFSNRESHRAELVSVLNVMGKLVQGQEDQAVEITILVFFYLLYFHISSISNAVLKFSNEAAFNAWCHANFPGQDWRPSHRRIDHYCNF